MTTRLRVGLIGAGPWASMVHAPLLSAGSTQLVGVWARRPDAAHELARQHGAAAYDRFEALLDDVEAVAFAVPPQVQAELAPVAARAGKALLLEKPLAADLPAAQRFTDEVTAAGVVTQLLLTWRYAAAVRDFLAAVPALGPNSGRGCFLGPGLLGGPFATPWRLAEGGLLDLGPHVVDLLDAALGTVVGVRAHRGVDGWVGLLLEHDTGAVSEASLSGRVGVDVTVAGEQVYGAEGALAVDCTAAVDVQAFRTAREEFVTAVRSGIPHSLDVRRGLHLQQVLHQAQQSLADAPERLGSVHRG